MWTWFTDTLVGALRPIPVSKHRLLSPLLPSAGYRKARVFGMKMELDLADLIGRAIYLGTYEREETRLVRSVLRPGHTFVDVGANIGYYTALAAAIVGRAGRIISIEPSPICFERLSKLHRDNSLETCALLNAGVSDTNGTLTLYQPLEHAGNLNSTMTPQPNCTQVSVPVRKLDEVLDELNVDAVDLLKIDIEGHEVRAFRGAQDALRDGRIRNILCEVNECHLHANGTNGREMMSFLADCGFTSPLLELPGTIPPPPGHSNFLLRRR